VRFGAISTRGRRVAALGLAIAFAALLFPALALALHEYEGSFGRDGSEGTVFAGFGSRAVGVDSGSGAVYVLNNSTETIYKFDENHQPANFSALGADEITGVPSSSGEGRSQLAIDATSHRIYATSGTAVNPNSIFAFEADGEPAEFSALASHEIGGFGELCGVAVDQNGDIYAGDLKAKKVIVYAPSGAKLTEFAVTETPPEPESGPCNLAVDSTGAVYVNHWKSSVEKFTPSVFPVTVATTYSSAGTVDSGPAYSVAVNPASNHLYVDRITKVVERDAGGGEVPPAFGATGEGALSNSSGIAVKGSGPSERIYASDLSGQRRVLIFGPSLTPPEPVTGPAGEVKKTTATVNGTLNPKGLEVTKCAFEYVEEAEYEPLAKNPYANGEEAPCDTLEGTPISGPGEIPADSTPHAVAAHLGTLAPDTKYHFRLVAANASGSAEGADGSAETLGAPVISEETASGVTASRARIGGLIDPRGEATTFAVEYVSAAEFAESEYAEAITVPLPFREVGSGIGNVKVSQELGGLAQGTTYHFRLVATNSVDPLVQGPDQTFTSLGSSSGLADGRAYEMVSPPAKAGEVFPPETEGVLSGTCDECLPGSDVFKMPMQPSPQGSAIVYEGQAFGGGTASEGNEYLAGRGAGGWASEGISGPQYVTRVGFEEQGQGFLAFAGDLSRGVISQVEPPLSSEAPADFANLYLWQRGAALEPLISEEPPQRGPSTVANSFLVVYGGANAGEGFAGPFTHIAFEANDALTGEVPGLAPAAPEVSAGERNLYEWSGGQLHLVNVLPNGDAGPDSVIGSGRLLSPNPFNEGPDFDHAISADGSRIFWSAKASGQVYLRVDGEETREIPDPAGEFLTASTDGSKVLLGDGKLFDTEPAVPTQVADLSAGLGGFQGILGAGEDLSRVYFVDTAVLSGGEENANSEHAEAGKDNLYTWQEGVGTSFIGRLAPVDNKFATFERAGAWHPSPSYRTAQVSADGRYLAFTSTARLTGYDNSQRRGEACKSAGVSPACSEVFEFDAGTGKLICASCNPGGERPLGYSSLSLISFGFRGTFSAQPENLTGQQGRVFFESQDTLSARDTNGHIQDVYEWEPDGVGSCTGAGGCVSLISSGHSANDSFFLNATPSGDDAFLVTRERLLPQDKDDYLDLYDARVGGGIAEGGGAPCGGEACKDPMVPAPIEPSPASPAFIGPENPPPPCRIGFVRKGGRCVKKKSKHKKQHRRAAKHHPGGSK
jgi:hypothetical protein